VQKQAQITTAEALRQQAGANSVSTTTAAASGVAVGSGGAAYEVEFTTLDGRTLTVATIENKKPRPVFHRDVAHVREMPAA
jgi:hypothetical protein